MTERPDLFAAAIPAVGALPNIPEFGTHKTEPGFRALLAMSTYHQIKDGVRYPAVLLTHGVNDLDWQAGHGVGDTKAQRQAERADVLAFLLWQFGMSR